VLLALIIAWLVVVLATSAWAALRGRRLWVTARAAQAEVERHIEAAELDQLPERMAELEQRQAQLAEALARLQASLAELRLLWNELGSVGSVFTRTRAFFTTK
jgi:chromosome segregation ATPase